MHVYETTLCHEKNCAKLFSSELCQLFANFYNYWHNNGKENEIILNAFFFVSANLRQYIAVLSAEFLIKFLDIRNSVCGLVSGSAKRDLNILI